LLWREIELVRPRRIVAFGILPFRHLTGRAIRLDHYFSLMERRGSIEYVPALRGRWPVAPCYFPVGRGNPRRATFILRLLAAELHDPRRLPILAAGRP
jgi:uracil-DNA glycosylase